MVQTGDGFFAELLVCVEDYDGFGARFGAGSCHVVSETSGTAGTSLAVSLVESEGETNPVTTTTLSMRDIDCMVRGSCL